MERYDEGACDPKTVVTYIYVNYMLLISINYQPYSKTKRYYNKANYTSINHALSYPDWTQILNDYLSIDEQWENFKSTINNVI